MVEQALILALLYIVLLFTVAWWAERRPAHLSRIRPLIYSFSLAVFCSSWTFFGAVGHASDHGWQYLPIYLGPTLLLLIGWPLYRKLLEAGHRHRTTSIADFIGSRYGKSQSLGAFVTLVAVVGTLPYIALQLKAITMAWTTLGGDQTDNSNSILYWDSALTTAVLMAVFAIVFGTRELDGRERHRGMMAAIAMESVVKLIAFASIALLACHYLLTNMPKTESLSSVAQHWNYNPINIEFVTQTLLSMVAIICLPRQFHVAVVEYQEPSDAKMARWIFPLYLLLFSLMVVPIVSAGKILLSSSGLSPDTYLLTLPLALNQPDLAIFAFIGGVSAATGMVIVATVTLSIMVSNEMVIPLWLQYRSQFALSTVQLGEQLRLVRRICIVALVLLSWAMFKLIEGQPGLTSIGLISFAAAAQLSPSLLASLYWKGGHRNGVITGLLAGCLVWFYCLLLPALLPVDHSFLIQGPGQLTWLKPQALFGFPLNDPLSHGLFWSLCSNILLFVSVSRFSKIAAKDRRQMQLFLSSSSSANDDSESFELTPIRVGQMKAILAPFLSKARERTLWREMEQRYQQRLLPGDRAPQFVAHEVEATLAGIIGSASAQRTIHLMEEDRQLNMHDIADMVGDTSRELSFNRNLLQTTVETIDQGVSVVDSKLHLVAWNKRYQQLFSYPERLLYVGCPVETLYRFNAERGLFGDKTNIDSVVQKRLLALSSSKSHRYERTLPNGTVLQINGNPMANGGYVTTYSDITDYKKMVVELEATKQTLEARVIERTSALSAAIDALRQENNLRADMEEKLREAHQSKTRFLAATSHDLLQPINAARLFVANLEQLSQETPKLLPCVERIDHSLSTAEQLISALREISHLDSGKQQPACKNHRVDTIIEGLAGEFSALAAQKGIQLDHIKSTAWIYTDKRLVSRILQNFLSNAVRYTKRGKIVIGCRRRKEGLRIEVWDTGPGISPAEREKIFNEFEQLHHYSGEAVLDRGLGLGLSIAKRTADLLEHPLTLHSVIGEGSCFQLLIPYGCEVAQPKKEKIDHTQTDLKNLKILCIDNEVTILEGLSALLSSWGCVVTTAENPKQAIEHWKNLQEKEIVLADYHLNSELDGLELMQSLEQQPHFLKGVLISADNSKSLQKKCKDLGYYYMAKPVKPASLRSLLRRIKKSSIND